jgi:hypothetical protein
MMIMHRVLLVPAVIAALLSPPAAAADDWSFIAGRYALDAKDCGPLAKGEPFSKNLVSALAQEVLTREGITSPREVHCKFRSAAKTENGWTVKADCEEMGESSPAELAVTAGPDGSLAVLNEDVYGPEPQKFQLCRE